MSKDNFYHEAGKGSKIRSSEDKEKFEEGWDRIWGKKDEDKQPKEQKKEKEIPWVDRQSGAFTLDEILDTGWH